MRDHERGPAFHQVGERPAHQRFRLRVELRSRLVQDQDRGVLVEGARDRETLFLSAGEPAGVFADAGLVALGQPVDELVGERGRRRRPDRLFRRAGPAVRDVLPGRGVEQDRVLGDDPDLAPQ